MGDGPPLVEDFVLLIEYVAFPLAEAVLPGDGAMLVEGTGEAGLVDEPPDKSRHGNRAVIQRY